MEYGVLFLRKGRVLILGQTLPILLRANFSKTGEIRNALEFKMAPKMMMLIRNPSAVSIEAGKSFAPSESP